MLRIFLLVLAILGLYLTLEPPLLIVADVPPVPGNVEIIAKPGVTAYETQIARRAVAFTVQVLEETNGMRLKHQVKLTLVPDLAAYLAVLVQDEGLDKNTALFQATQSAGSSRENRVIVNMGGIERYHDAIFVVAHELTHQYQTEALGDWSRLNWLTEGMADVVAARVVEVNSGAEPGERRNPMRQYREAWLKAVADAKRRPALAALDTRADWIQAVQQYGPVIAYRISSLAVFQLIDTSGFSTFARYLELRGKGMQAEAAFEAAFGKTLDTFITEYPRLLEIQLAAPPPAQTQPQFTRWSFTTL